MKTVRKTHQPLKEVEEGDGEWEQFTHMLNYHNEIPT
jgi:hypothetical protein